MNHKINELKRKLKEAEDEYARESKLKSLNALNILNSLIKRNDSRIIQTRELNKISKELCQKGLRFNPLDHQEKIESIRSDKAAIRELRTAFVDVLFYELDKSWHIREKWAGGLLRKAMKSMMDSNTSNLKGRMMESFLNKGSAALKLTGTKISKNLDFVFLTFAYNKSVVNIEWKIKTSELQKLIKNNGVTR